MRPKTRLNRQAWQWLDRQTTDNDWTDLPGAAEYDFQVPYFDRIVCGFPW